MLNAELSNIVIKCKFIFIETIICPIGHGVKMNNKTKIILIAVLVLSAMALGASAYEVDDAYALDADEEARLESNNDIPVIWFYGALGAVGILVILALSLYRRKHKF